VPRIVQLQQPIWRREAIISSRRWRIAGSHDRSFAILSPSAGSAKLLRDGDPLIS